MRRPFYDAVMSGMMIASLVLVLGACNLGQIAPTEEATVTEPTQIAGQPTNTSQPAPPTATQPPATAVIPPTVPPTAAPPPTAIPTFTPVPTDTPEPIIPTNTQEPPPPTVDDACLSAQGVAAPQRDPVRTLPNGQPFPGKAPLQIDPAKAAEQAESSGFQAQSTRGQGDFPQEEVVIQFEPDATAEERQQLIAETGGRVVMELPALNSVVVRLNPGRGAEFRAQAATDALTRLNASPRVRRSEPNFVAAAQQVSIPPNDTRYNEQWAFPVVGLPDAWQGLDTSSTVTIAVVDSGICPNHPDLQGKLLPGRDFVDGDNNPTDVFGHGCNVTGVIAAIANNNQGIAGAAPNVRVMPLRVLNELGVGSYSRIAEAIVYATDNGADIINLSLGASSYSSVLEQAVQYALARGVILVAAAGNYGREGALYPAAFDGVVAVGSIDPNLQRSSFSHFGANVDMYAPGRDIITTNLAGDYELVTGTSFAAPLVAALTAIRPNFERPFVTNDQIAYVPPPQVAACP